MSRQLLQNPLRTAITKIEVLTGVVVVGLALWFIVPAMAHRRVRQQREMCLANLLQIGQAVDAYLQTNDNCWPYVAKLRSFKMPGRDWPTLPEVLSPYGAPAELFHCPADARELSAQDDAELMKKFPAATSWYATEGLSYEWYWGEIYGGNKVGQERVSQAKGFGFGRADQTLLADFEPFHKGDDNGAVNALFADFKARTSRPTKLD